MPLFYFVLKIGPEKIIDREELEFPDAGAARIHAVAVARELMRNREVQARTWRLEVCDDYLLPCFELVFAEADTSLDHLHPEYRESVEAISRSRAALHEGIGDVRCSLVDVKESFARLDRVIAGLNGPLISRGQIP